MLTFIHSVVVSSRLFSITVRGKVAVCNSSNRDRDTAAEGGVATAEMAMQ